MPKLQMEQRDKAVMAAYLNLARHNIFLIINHVQQKLGLDLLDNDEGIAKAQLWEMLYNSTNNVPEENTTIVKLLNRHFSFINENQDPANLKAFFLSVLKRLNEERNNYTHAYHEKEDRTPITVEIEKEGHINNLENCLVKAKQFLEDKIKEGFERQELAASRGETLPQLYRGFGKEALATLQGLDLPLYQANGIHLTQEGLAFFTALFLDKPNAARFLDSVPILKNHPQALLIKEWLWTYACRIPQPKLESGEVSMDILNELHRAPKPLYHFLSEEDKRRFEVDFHHEDIILMEALGNQKNQLKREDNRFPYFAMRVMDETKLFDQLRFQVHLGKWLRKEYKSTTIEERKIYENLRTFGRLNFFKEENAPADWKKLDSQHQDEEESANWYIPAIEQFAPHYLATGNRVGIKINRSDSAGDWKSLSDYRPLQKEDRQGRKEKAKINQPDAMVSIYDLANLFFYQYLHKKGEIEQSAEDFINQHIQQFYRFCEDAKTGKIEPIAKKKFKKKSRRPHEPISEENQYSKKESQQLYGRKKALQKILDEQYTGLLCRHLPDHLLEYLIGYDLSTQKAAELKLTQRKRDTQQLHRKLMKSIDKILLRERLVPEKFSVPNLAKFLTEDIIEWRPINKRKQKFAKKETEQLELLLNNFPHNKTDLEAHIMGNRRGKRFPKSMRLIDHRYDYAHPFLHKANPLDRKDLRDFYKAYTEEKIKWLTQLQQTPRKNEDPPTKYFRNKTNNEKGGEKIAHALKEAKATLPTITDYLKTQDAVLGGSSVLKNGDLATYLVKDIIFLKPKDTTKGAKNFGKPNNQEYKRLHSMLALYSTDVAGMVAFMAQLGLLGKPKESPYVHPFLAKTKPAERAGVKEFYEYYLNAKIEWLEKLEKEVTKGNLKRYQRYFGQVQSPKKVKTYTNIPVLLPRGLFNGAIRQALSKDASLDIQEEDNFVTCLKKYAKADTQPFYKWTRTYEQEELEPLVWKDDKEVWDTRIREIKEKIAQIEEIKVDAEFNGDRLTKEEFQELKQLKKLKRKAMGNEQQIRMHQHTDRVLKTMLQLLTEDKKPQDAFFLDTEKIQLAAIHPEHRNSKSSIAAQQMPIGSTNLLDEPIVMEMEIGEKRIIDLLSLKRHGAFRRFFKDRRLSNLVKYFTPTISQKTAFEKLLTYWEGLKEKEQIALLSYLKMNLKEEALLQQINADGYADLWTTFDRDYRKLITHYFDASIFEVAQLQQLLQQMNEQTILRRQLVQELGDYDAKRASLYEKILAFEQKVYDTFPSTFHQRMLDRPVALQHYLKHKAILKLVQQKLSKAIFSDTVLQELLNFRNYLSHNEIYYSDYLKNKIVTGDGKIVAPLFEHIIRTYHWLITEMTNLEEVAA